MKLLSGRLRIVDAVIVAAVGLLALKALPYLATSSAPETGPGGLPKFARVLAHARSNPPVPDPDTTGSVPPKDAKPAGATPAAGAATAPPPDRGAEEPDTAKGSPSERALRERIGERREELARRARDLETREKLIEEAERRVDTRSEEARLADERAAAAADPSRKEAAALKGLVVMYETMKPKDAARVFDRLPEDVLVPVVRQIAPRKMAEIMAAMTSEAAQKLTIALARPVASTAPAGTAAPGLPPGELPAIEPPPRPTSRAAN